MLTKKMASTKEEKAEIIAAFRKNPKDTGSPEVQIALLSARITHLTEHYKNHKKDLRSRRGLLALVGRRKKLLTYLSKKNNKSYKNIIKELRLRT